MVLIYIYNYEFPKHKKAIIKNKLSKYYLIKKNFLMTSYIIFF